MTTTTRPIIGAHLDLKYLMPSNAHLHQLVDDLPKLGVNTLLVEYEDKFPWQGHPFLRAADAFDEHELHALLTRARAVGLRVIPLVQTFSHLEFALAHEQLASLRELPHIHMQINPANPEAVAFVNGLVDEVLAFHESDEYFHLGGDEVWHMGANPANHARHAQLGSHAYWLEHMRPLMERISAAGKRPMVWDDIFWDNAETIERLDVPDDLVLVSWDYSMTPAAPASHGRTAVYRQAGLDVIGAGCVNWGVMTPRHQHCLDNVTAWAHKVHDEGLQGVIHTAWAAFHVPLAVCAWHYAAANPSTTSRSCSAQEWEQAFHQSWFGIDDSALIKALPGALRETGVLWEHRSPQLERPITLPVYGYMDVLMHYPGGITERRARGVYPLDWSEVDHVALLRRKLDILRHELKPAAIESKLAELEAAYRAAQPTLDHLARQATCHRATAAYLNVTNTLKLAHTRIMRALMLGHADAADQQPWHALRTPLHQALSAFFTPASVDRLMSIWWEPTARVLEHDGR